MKNSLKSSGGDDSYMMMSGVSTEIIEDSYTYDAFLDEIGGFGRFQWYASAVVIGSFMTGGHIVYGLSYLEKYPDYLCRLSSNDQFFKCDRSFICQNRLAQENWQIDYTSKESFKNWVDPEKLDLTCESQNMIGLIGSSFFLGAALSMVITPRLSDMYGRKFPFLVSILVQTLSYTIIILSQDIRLTILCYLVVGLCCGGRVAVGTTYIMELVPTRFQNSVITLLSMIDASSLIIQSILYYFYRDWFVTHCFQLAMALVLVPMIAKIPESPKYLYASGRYDEARDVLGVISAQNGNLISQSAIQLMKFDKEVKYSDMEQNNGWQKVQNTQEINMFKIKELRINLVAMSIIFSTTCYSYFLIGSQMKNIGGDMIINTINAQISEIVAYLSSGFIYQALGPKRSFASMFALAMVGSFVLIISIDEDVIPIMIVITKFGVSATFNMAFIALVQLFPTKVAASAFGIVNVFGRGFTILAPLIAESPAPIPSMTITVAATLSFIASHFLYEKLP